ncbi:primosomal protein N' [candidate division WOR-3 bacterium]|nr:primosomal protein N' [candidate division WOR-3 bacterium]
MKVDVAIPRTKIDMFTYDCDDDVHVGDLVLVPLRNKTTHGVVVNLNSKRPISKLKKIIRIVHDRFIPESLIALYQWIADYYLATMGEVLRLALPSKILKDPDMDVPPAQPVVTAQPPTPTLPQTAAIQEIIANLDAHRFKTYLLYGITGSGKTEVYLRAADHVITQGGRVLILVPEISLTPLLYSRFKERFGDETITIHSGLTQKQRRIAWYAIHQGKYKVIIGPRSAVFVPIPDLKMIVVDEEHDTSYKEHERMPHYNARDSAVMRGKLENLTVVLGSATPQIESYHNAQIGKYALLTLEERIEKRSLPQITMIDLRSENKRFISPALETKLQHTLAQGEQAIIFLNRRGFAPHLICPKCGYVVRCKFCGLPMVYHKPNHGEGATLSCHICSHKTKKISICPHCHRGTLLYRGAGTQRIEEMVNRIVADLQDKEKTKDISDCVLRLDRDIARKRGQAEEIFEKFERGDARILLGTQLVTKGFDFPDVTLVGIVNADVIINLPDFRSSERTFQMLTQVAGRSGRGAKKGIVLMQTFHPEQYAILFSQLQDYRKFYEHEIRTRKELDFPPFARLVLVRVKGQNADRIAREAEKIAQRLKRIKEIAVYGPNRSFYYKVRKDYRVFILVKMQKNFNHARLRFLTELKPSGCTIDVDVDPMDVF